MSKISVHIIARERTEYGRRLFQSCVEAIAAVEGYAHEIVIIDNGCRGDTVDMISDWRENLGIPVKVRQLPKIRDDFAFLRNAAIGETSEECTHFHKIDTDEIYPEAALWEIRDLVGSGVDRLACQFFHHIANPYNRRIDLAAVPIVGPMVARWEGEIHERFASAKTPSIKNRFWHYGHTRLDIQIALKMVRYHRAEHGGDAAPIAALFDENEWNAASFQDPTGNESTDRPHPPSFHENILGPFHKSGCDSWPDWLYSLDPEWLRAVENWSAWVAAGRTWGEWVREIAARL